MGFNPQWIGAGPTSEAPFQVLAGEAAVGTVHMWPGKYLVSDTHVPMIAKFREEFRKRIGEKPGRPSTAELVNYAGAMVFVEALKRAGKALSRENFVEALESIKNFETPLADLVSFSKDNHHGNYKVTFVVNLPNMHRALLNVSIAPK
jgi:branched-chain amino acid transport system substrate-binding protein